MMLLNACGSLESTSQPQSAKNLNEQLARGEVNLQTIKQLNIFCIDSSIAFDTIHSIDNLPSVILDNPDEIRQLLNELADGGMYPIKTSEQYQQARLIATLHDQSQAYFDYKIMHDQQSSKIFIPNPDPAMPSLNLDRGGMRLLAQKTAEACANTQ